MLNLLTLFNYLNFLPQGCGSWSLVFYEAGISLKNTLWAYVGLLNFILLNKDIKNQQPYLTPVISHCHHFITGYFNAKKLRRTWSYKKDNLKKIKLILYVFCFIENIHVFLISLWVCENSTCPDIEMKTAFGNHRLTTNFFSVLFPFPTSQCFLNISNPLPFCFPSHLLILSCLYVFENNFYFFLKCLSPALIHRGDSLYEG